MRSIRYNTPLFKSENLIFTHKNNETSMRTAKRRNEHQRN